MASPPQNRVLLLGITGHDKAGLTHSLTAILSAHSARILDIGQAVIHDSLALGILVELTAEMESSGLAGQLLEKAEELGVHIRFTEISGADYDGWVSAQSKRRYLLTLLGTCISAEHLMVASGIAARHGLNIDSIDRLSGRTPLENEAGTGRVCIELAVSGEPGDEEKIREELLQMTASYDLDVAFQQDSLYRRTRRLVAFDMDSTLIQGEVIDELAKLAGVGEQVQAITEAAMRGELDFQASFRKRVSLLKGLPASALDEVILRVPLMDGAERLVTTLRRLGYKTAILSGGFTFFGRTLQQRLGIDYLHANELAIVDGIVTGEVIPPIVDGARKAEMLKMIAEKENLTMDQVIAVGDGANDLPMLSMAGLGIAFRAKPVVRRSAKQAISKLGLDGILYLLGVRDRDTLG